MINIEQMMKINEILQNSYRFHSIEMYGNPFITIRAMSIEEQKKKKYYDKK